MGPVRGLVSALLLMLGVAFLVYAVVVGRIELALAFLAGGALVTWFAVLLSERRISTEGVSFKVVCPVCIWAQVFPTKPMALAGMRLHFELEHGIVDPDVEDYT